MATFNRVRVSLLWVAGCILAGGTVAAADQVSGFVLEAGTLSPVRDAVVTLQATAIRVHAENDGSFVLPVSGTGLVIVGAGKGYFNEAIVVDSPATGVQILLDPVPQDDDPNYALIPPATCGGCHPTQFAEWTGTPMAKAGLNSWVTDIYNGNGTAGGMGGFVYTRDSVHAASNPNSECASCHQPHLWIDAPFAALDDEIVTPSAEVMHGVSCDVCHKIADIPFAGQNFPGIYPGVVTFTRPQGPLHSQVQYGVLGDVDYANTLMRGSYQPQLVAEVCGVCHQDKNDPDEDGNFEEPNGVISEPTYLEWAASAYGDPQSPQYATCVDCHMPPNDSTQLCAVIQQPRPVGTIRSHTILGTTPDYLENAVELALTSQVIDDTLEVEASITNSLTGHHVPTGVTVRNMILLIEAWREQDSLPLISTGTQTVHDLGGIGDPAQGYYAGLPGKYFSKINHDANLNGPTFFTDATGIASDNRIPALATDVSNYSFDVPPGGGSVRVRARLIYRRAFRFLVDAKNWTEDGHGQPLADIAPPHFGHLMELEEAVVDLCPGGAPAEIDDSLRVDSNGVDASIEWDDEGLGGPFKVYRGLQDAGTPFAYNHVCFDNPAIAGTADGDVPTAGRLHYYLVSRGGCGESGLGSGSGGPRPNDLPCPLN